MKIRGHIFGILSQLSCALHVNHRRLLEQQLKVFSALETCYVTNIDTCSVNCYYCDSGRVRCEFCEGAGFLILGHDLIGTNNIYPVCVGAGEQNCKKCSGTGRIAKWTQ